jgi:cytochrome c556
MKQVLLGGACLVLAAIGFARAQTSEESTRPEDFIATRQAGMELQYAVAGDMKRAVAAKLDVHPYKDGADAIVLWSRAIPGLFPAGTDKGHDTKAKPEIWSDRAGFEKAAARLTDAARKLSQAAGSGDKAQFAAAFQATDQACAACHHSYERK